MLLPGSATRGLRLRVLRRTDPSADTRVPRLPAAKPQQRVTDVVSHLDVPVRPRFTSPRARCAPSATKGAPSLERRTLALRMHESQLIGLPLKRLVGLRSTPNTARRRAPAKTGHAPAFTVACDATAARRGPARVVPT